MRANGTIGGRLRVAASVVSSSQRARSTERVKGRPTTRATPTEGGAGAGFRSRFVVSCRSGGEDEAVPFAAAAAVADRGAAPAASPTPVAAKPLAALERPPACRLSGLASASSEQQRTFMHRHAWLAERACGGAAALATHCQCTARSSSREALSSHERSRELLLPPMFMLLVTSTVSARAPASKRDDEHPAVGSSRLSARPAARNRKPPCSARIGAAAAGAEVDTGAPILGGAEMLRLCPFAFEEVIPSRISTRSRHCWIVRRSSERSSHSIASAGATAAGTGAAAALSARVRAAAAPAAPNAPVAIVLGGEDELRATCGSSRSSALPGSRRAGEKISSALRACEA